MLATIMIVIFIVFSVVQVAYLLPGLSFERRMKSHMRLTNLSNYAGNSALQAAVELPYGEHTLTNANFVKAFALDVGKEYRLPDFKFRVAFPERHGTEANAVIYILKGNMIQFQGKIIKEGCGFRLYQGDSFRMKTLDGKEIAVAVEFI